MTADDFRSAALGFAGAIESSHMGHPDFRVAKKIFATLNEDETLGMVKLTPEQQGFFMEKAPDAFSPCAGAWGKGGMTYVHLAVVREDAMLDALETAWRNLSVKKSK